MPDSKRFLHPEAIKRIARMDLRARQVVEGYLSGMHRSPHFGQSVEFRQHRQYTPGDDLRHVDWQVWARQDRLYIKQYESDEKMQVNLLVDISNSMTFGNGHLNKFEYGATIAVCLAYLAIRNQDSVGCMTFDNEIRNRLRPMSNKSQLHAIMSVLDAATLESKTDMTKILGNAAESLTKRGMVILISDLLSDSAATLKSLRLLTQRGHDVLVFHVMDDEEIDFPFTGPTKFQDMESDTTVNCNPKALKAGYLDALNEFLDELRRGCAKSAIQYALVKTGDSLDAVLAQFLSARMAM